jgi:hypothetical protein
MAGLFKKIHFLCGSGWRVKQIILPGRPWVWGRSGQAPKSDVPPFGRDVIGEPLCARQTVGSPVSWAAISLWNFFW